MPIHRKRLGNKNRVWALSDEVDGWINSYLKNLNSLDETEVEPRLISMPKKKVKNQRNRFGKMKNRLISSKTKLVMMSLLAILFSLSIFMILSSQKQNDLKGFLLVKGEDDLVQKIDIWDDSGKITRTIWEAPSLWDARQSYYLEKDNARRMLAIRPTTRKNPAALMDCLNNRLFVHYRNKSHPVSLPDLSVKTEADALIDDIRAVQGVYWIDEHSYQGWALLVASVNEFPSCLLLLDERMQVKGKLYHPGRLHDLVCKDNTLIVTGSLNARETRFANYRPALFKVALSDIVGKSAQLVPFSSKSIPSIARRNYYRIKGLQECPFSVYLALAPHSVGRLFLSVEEDHVSWLLGLYPESRITITFDQNLRYKNKFFLEHAFNEGKNNPERIWNSSRFQYWQVDAWGPWIAERLPWEVKESAHN